MDLFRFPLARIAGCFVPGIAFAYYLKPNITIVAISLTAAFLILALAYAIAAQDFRQKIYYGLMVSVTAFLFGMTTQTIHDCRLDPEHYLNKVTDAKQHLIYLVLREKLKSTARGKRYIAVVKSIDGENASGKILLNLTDAGNNFFVAGTGMFVSGQIVKNKRPLNPDQFDYGRYLDNKSVPAQIYAKKDALRLSGNIYKDIWYYSDAFRNRIIRNLKNHGFRENELQVANALILGQQQEIAPDIVQDYQYAGAVHILSVSGLHVGFILLFLNFLLRPLPQSRNGRLARLIIVLIALWVFAIVAGLSPSVVRSAAMFSFVALGMSLRRSTNIFHTMIVSVLLILLFEPSFLFDVGFQLSYAALFFILWLQPSLSGLWNPGNKVAKYFWDILTVSFAAQIGTLPLSIYYFHQFPGLFFVTNLIVIPFLSIIMIVGILVLTMAAFGWVPHLPALVLERSIFLMDAIISRVASLENFILRDIPLNFPMLLGSYLLIFTFVLWFRKPAFARLFSVMISITVLQCIVFFSFWKTGHEKEWIVFNAHKDPVIAERNGRMLTIFNKNQRQNQFLKPYRIAHFCSFEKQYITRNLYWFEGYKILRIDSSAVYPVHLQPEILLLSGSPKINLERVLLQLKPKIIIADGSNFKSYAARWKQTCEKRKIPFHDTREKGFFRLNK